MLKQIWKKINDHISKYFSLYVFLFVVFMVGNIAGAILLNRINETNSGIILTNLQNFFTNVETDSLANNFEVFKESLILNFTYIFIIWLLGISIIGIPIVVFMVFLKGFTLGFTIAFVVKEFKLAGMFGTLFYIFPHNVILVLVVFIMSMYSLLISLNIIKSIIKKQTIVIHSIFSRYFKMLVFSFGLVTVASFVEAYVVPYLVKFYLTITT